MSQHHPKLRATARLRALRECRSREMLLAGDDPPEIPASNVSNGGMPR